MVMPLYDDNPFKLPHTPVVSWSLIGITIVAFILEFSANDDPLVIANQFGVIPAAVVRRLQFSRRDQPAADAGHLPVPACRHRASDRQPDLRLGVRRQCRAGARPLALPGVLSPGRRAGALAFVFSDPGSKVPLIGASGSVSGVVIAYLMLRPCAKLTALVLGIPLRISAYWIIGVFIAIQFINLGVGDEERRRLVVPHRRHAGRRRCCSR